MSVTLYNIYILYLHELMLLVSRNYLSWQLHQTFTVHSQPRLAVCSYIATFNYHDNALLVAKQLESCFATNFGKEVPWHNNNFINVTVPGNTFPICLDHQLQQKFKHTKYICGITKFGIQWNPSKADTIGTKDFVLYREVSGSHAPMETEARGVACESPVST